MAQELLERFAAGRTTLAVAQSSVRAARGLSRMAPHQTAMCMWHKQLNLNQIHASALSV